MTDISPPNSAGLHPPDSPRAALDTLEQSLAQAAGLAAENATLIQQQENVAAQAVLTASVDRLLGAQEAR